MNAICDGNVPFPFKRVEFEEVQKRQIAAIRKSVFESHLASRAPMLRSLSLMRANSPVLADPKYRTSPTSSPKSPGGSKLARSRTMTDYMKKQKKRPSFSSRNGKGGATRRPSFQGTRC
eukprot:scaffold923_cov256-Pinguiococcus_pyrenoidosus.AAC.19